MSTYISPDELRKLMSNGWSWGSSGGTTPRIGSNGNWWIGDTDTGVSASGSGSGGSAGGWELLNTITLAEDSNDVIINQDSNGNSFELSAFMFYIDRVASELQESNSTLYVGSSRSGYFGQMQGQSATQTRLWMSGEFMTNHMWRSVGGNGASGNFLSSISYAGGCLTSASMIRLYGYYFGTGTKIYLYGVKK